MPYTKIWIHSVWGTKNRSPFLIKDIRQKLIHHIRENAIEKKIYIDKLNGYTDHLHCLIKLNADMSVSKALQLIKGESAFWINKERITNSRFEWADEYFAASVSESMIDKVRNYIDMQEEHHRKMTFLEEYERFINAYKTEGVG